MNPVSEWNDRPPEDLTARARIRDAALNQFAKHGFKGATIKGIADAAGVSHGLLQHHFGSKDELRRACDEYVQDSFGGLDRFGVTSGEIANPDFLRELSAKSPLILRYISRAMVDGAPIAAAFFETGASVAEEFLSGQWPDRFPAGSGKARDAATVMAAMHLSTVVLHEQMSQRMGADTLAPGTSSRVAMAIFDVYSAMAEFGESNLGHGVKDAVVKQHNSHANGQEDE